MKDIKILYEDNHLLVVVKPRNMLSQQDSTNDQDILTILKQYIKGKYSKPGNVYLGLVHRLDRPTVGIMVFARTSKAAERLSNQIKNGQFCKKYLALVHGTFVKKEGVLLDYLTKDEENNNSFVSDETVGKYAELSYKVLKEYNNLSLIDVILKTGRHHQIRVQFKNINHPLVGDMRYNNEKGDLMLCAYHLEFDHPVSKRRLVFEYIPKEFEIC